MKIEDYSKYYIQGSDHYLIPKDIFTELFDEMVNWKEESNKQKEVIDKAIELLNKFSFEINVNGQKQYIKLQDLSQGKEVLKLLNGVSE